jgi:hypothetical protein
MRVFKRHMLFADLVMNDSSSVTSTVSGRKGMIERVIDKLTTYMQKDENKRWLQVFVIDPVLNHILDRIFPYIVLMSIIFVVLIILVVLTFFIVFTKVPKAFPQVIV